MDKNEVKTENLKNGINIERMHRIRLQKLVSKEEISELMGVHVKRYSSYEMLRNPMPKFLYEKALEELEKYKC